MLPHVLNAMPSIPITHLKLPNVVWYRVGEDVDMYFSDAWWHAIVVETKDVVATNVNDVRIMLVFQKAEETQHE
jgi:hypothetical protein